MRRKIMRVCDRCGNPGHSEFPTIKVTDKGSKVKRNFVVCEDCSVWAMTIAERERNAENPH